MRLLIQFKQGKLEGALAWGHDEPEPEPEPPTDPEPVRFGFQPPVDEDDEGW